MDTARLSVVVLAVAAIALSACASARGNLQGFEGPIEDEAGAFAFRWVGGPEGQEPVEVHILEIVDLSKSIVVFRDDTRFRARDINVAAWASQPGVLLVYAGDVGTATIAMLDNGTWGYAEVPGCLSGDQTKLLDQAVVERLPSC